jgi:hypothetical protein
MSIVTGDGGRFTTPSPLRLEARSRLGEKAASELGAPAVSSIPVRLRGSEPASATKGREDERAALWWNRWVAGQTWPDGQPQRSTEPCSKPARRRRTLPRCPPRQSGVPVRKGVPVNFKTRPLSNPGECAEAFGDILAAIGRGELTPDEGNMIGALIERRANLFAKRV